MEFITFFGQSQYKARDIQLFQGVTGSDLVAINNLIAPCKVVSAKAGAAIIHAHSNDNPLYAVLKGGLKLQQSESASVQAMHNLHYLTGECAGELSVLDDEDQSHTILATCDSELLIIDTDTLWELIDKSNCMARNLLRLLSFRIRTTNAFLRRRHQVGEFYRQLSMIDGLTGIHNRAWLNSQLPHLIQHSHSTGSPLSIIMADLDNFKLFNDTHGHIIGDDAIQCAAKILNSTLRPTDFAVRFGGEELLVILPDTSKEACFSVAKRLCTRLAKSSVFKDQRQSLPHITASFGVTNLNEGQDIFTLIAAADAALYRAKKAGRNQVSY